MFRKLIYLVCFVLVMSLTSNAFAWAWAEAVTDWTNATGDGLWQTPGNWTLRVPGPEPVLPGTSNTRINPDMVVGPNVGPYIGLGVNAYTSEMDTWGPEFGLNLDIEGGTYSGPAWVGLNAYNPDANFTGEINLGRDDTGGSIAVVGLLVGDSWWDRAGYNVAYNQYSGVCIASDWIWLGGKMNLYGGYTSGNGFSLGRTIIPAGQTEEVPPQPPSITTLNISGGMLSLPVGLYDDGTIAGWIANGYLVANGGAAGYHIAFDLEMEIDRVVLTSVPEPATIVLLGLGGLALIRRKRS